VRDTSLQRTVSQCCEISPEESRNMPLSSYGVKCILMSGTVEELTSVIPVDIQTDGRTDFPIANAAPYCVARPRVERIY